MKYSSELIVGWCPGALKPFESGDGLIVRVRLHQSKLSLVQLETLVGAAERFADGNLYLSNRANVQLRGVTGEKHQPLLDVLASASLLDSDVRVEAIRNIQVSPAVELSAHAELTAGLVARLEDALARNEALYQLPGKFGMAVQAGNEIDTAVVSDVVFLVQDERIAMALEGALDKAILFDSTNAAAEGFVSIAKAFLHLRRVNPAIRRMRDAVALLGVEGVAEEAGLQAVAHGLRVSEAPAPVGDLGDAYGIGFAYGEVTREALREIARTMRREGIAEASVSPQRALVFPAEGQQKSAFADLAKRLDAISDPGDIRLRLHRCAGAPACRRGTVESKRDAGAVLCALAGTGFKGKIHISACEKLCAYQHETEITAIAKDGYYTVTGPGSKVLKAVSGADLPAVIAELARAA
jgi:precorrin-3B synthase